ncbi:hypothetical protein AVEN_192816-1, partial [Araneus ventricosus]
LTSEDPYCNLTKLRPATTSTLTPLQDDHCVPALQPTASWCSVPACRFTCLPCQETSSADQRLSACHSSPPATTPHCALYLSSS